MLRLTSAVQHRDSVIPVCIIFHILLHDGLSQHIEHSSLCWTAGTCCLSSCIYWFTPANRNPIHPRPHSPLAVCCLQRVCFCFADEVHSYRLHHWLLSLARDARPYFFHSFFSLTYFCLLEYLIRSLPPFSKFWGVLNDIFKLLKGCVTASL